MGLARAFGGYFLLILLYTGCMPRGADGRYHSVYSYHPYNHYETQNRLPIKRDNFLIPPLPSFSVYALNKVENLAKSQLGKPYRWGANGPYDFDCSGFTRYVFSHNGIDLPRVSRDQAKVGIKIDRNHLKKGDLIFFDSPKSTKVTHTGIYLGENRFIHASSSKKRVVISPLQGYYEKHFKWGRRVLEN